MPVKRVVPSGYCLGVVRAINIARKVAAENKEQPVYILGMLVHSRYVVEALNALGVTTINDPGKTKYELLDSIDNGIVIFTAHGISDDIKQYASYKGLTTVDASCPFVLNNRKLIKEKLEQGYEVLYIGKQNHPESEAIISMSEGIHLVTGDKLPKTENDEKIFVTNQTTMSMYDVEEIMSRIKTVYPQAVIAPEVCDATRMRQQAVMDLKDTDILIVVGDPSSNNTAQLANIGKAAGIKEVYKIETSEDLKGLNIDTGKNIAVTAGASTPKALTDSVISYLNTGDEQFIIPDMKKMLDQ